MILQALVRSLREPPQEVTDPKPVFPTIDKMTEDTPPQEIYDVIAADVMVFMEAWVVHGRITADNTPIQLIGFLILSEGATGDVINDSDKGP